MTVVGDIAQTGDPAGSTSWHDALEPHVPGRWRLEQLSVCYRTPAEIMAVAAPVLAAIDPSLEVPRSVREAGTEPWATRVDPADLRQCVVDAVRAEVLRTGEGTVGVILPVEAMESIGRALAEAQPGTAVGAQADLESPVVVLTVREAKGLEFDSVLVVDPARIVAESARGYRDLYVALTRATQRLGVLSSSELPPELSGLATSPAVASERRPVSLGAE
jgi:DNA helicase IV